MARTGILSLLAIIVLSFAIYGLSYYSVPTDLRSGNMSTVIEGERSSIAVYSLSQGEKVQYEWESDFLVRFVITTDPFQPLAEFVNITGLDGNGAFVSPADATYYAHVTFLEVPPGIEARIHYMTYRITGLSELMPVILASTAVALVGLLLWNWRKGRAGMEVDGKREFSGFWHFFVADYKNWIAVVVGAVLLVCGTTLSSITTNHLDHDHLIGWLNFAGRGFVFWGLVFGLWLSHNSYKSQKSKQGVCLENRFPFLTNQVNEVNCPSDDAVEKRP